MSFARCQPAFRIALLVVLPACSSSQTPEARPLSVCEVLERLDLYRNKIIVIQGWYSINTRHGIRRVAEKEDEQPCPGFKGRQADWPGAIHVVSPEDGPTDGPAMFLEERTPARLDLQEWARKTRYGLKTEAVLEGELRSRRGIRIRRDRYGEIVGNGYGRHLNYPAQLVLRRLVSADLRPQVF